MFDVFLAKKRVRELLALLEEERQIIVQGRFSDFTRYELKREKLIGHFDGGDLMYPAEDIQKIRAEAERNRALLKASLGGVQSAISAVTKSRREAETFGTYTDSGRRIELVSQIK